MIISETQKETILGAIEDLFGTAQAKLLGRYFAGNRIYFTAAQNAPFENTIEGLYRYALKAHNPLAEVDEEALRALMQITNNYIEAHKLKVINATLNDALGAKKAEDLFAIVKENLDKATKYMDMLIVTETQMVRAYANKEGIQQIALSVNDDDPYVVWTGKIDSKLCPVCRAMYHSSDNVQIPKVFRLSELQSGYFNKKTWDGHSPYTAGHPRCFDKETEVLTDSGWKLFDELKGHELFLSVNPESLNGEWVRAIGSVKYRYTGKMHSYINKTTDLLITPNHIQPVIKNKKMIMPDSSSLFNKDFARWGILRHIPNWQGNDGDFLFDGHTDRKLIAELLGYWLSEGYIEDLGENRKTFKFVICQQKYPDIMMECMKKFFKVDNIYYKHEKLIIYWPKDSDIFRLIKDQGKSWEKTVPTFIKESSIEVMNAFLEAFQLGDGSKRTRSNRMFDGQKTPSIEICYHTSSQVLASDLTEMILKMGLRPTMVLTEARTIQHHNGLYTTKHPTYLVRQNKGALAHCDSLKITEIDYDDFVHDVELEKNHTLFVKRNGRIALSGNCRHLMGYLAKNFGFDEKGHVQYKYMGYDALLDQRGLGKSELPFVKVEFGDIDQYILDGMEHDAHEHDSNCKH